MARPEKLKPLLARLLLGSGVLFFSAGLHAQTVVNYLVVEDKSRPFQIVEAGESRGGIVSDMVDAIFASSDYEVEHLVYPVNRLRQVVAEEQVDHWVAYEAVQWQTFGHHGWLIDEPLFNTHHVMLTCRADLPERISSIDDIRGLKVLTLRHFDYESLDLAAADGRIRQIPVDRYEAGIKLVSLGRADGFVEMESRLDFHVQANRELSSSCLRWLDFSPVIPDYSIYLSIDIDWPPAFRDFVKQRIRHLRASGELERILGRYLNSDHRLDARPVAQ